MIRQVDAAGERRNHSDSNCDGTPQRKRPAHAFRGNKRREKIMLNKKAQNVLLGALLFFVVSSTGGVLAQTLQTTNAGPVGQVFASTTSTPATFSNPSGAFQPLDSMTVNLRFNSLLVISFGARGSVAPSTTATPIVFVKCQIDGTPCQPNFNPVEFLYPQFCCDTRSFTWVVHAASIGTHTVTILWGMGNPTSAIISNRTLVVEAAVRL
jgi:hypothetical protein